MILRSHLDAVSRLKRAEDLSIAQSPIVDSIVTRDGFRSSRHGFQSLPQWISSESQLVDCAVPHSGLHGPSQRIPKSPLVDSAADPLSELTVKRLRAADFSGFLDSLWILHHYVLLFKNVEEEEEVS